MSVVQEKIPSTKGNLAAAIHYPDSESKKLAILCPGFCDSKDYKGLVGLADELTARGFVAARFDPTGTWESEGDIPDYTTTQYLEDIRNVLEYMLSKGAYETVLLGGHSRGGQMSILYAAQDPRITCVLGIMASSSRPTPTSEALRKEWEETGIYRAVRNLPDDEKAKREFLVPVSHSKDREKYDALEAVKKIKAPLVLVAGGADTVVPPGSVKEYFDNANKPKRFIVLENIGHDYRHSDEEVKVVNEKVVEQLTDLGVV